MIPGLYNTRLSTSMTLNCNKEIFEDYIGMAACLQKTHFLF